MIDSLPIEFSELLSVGAPLLVAFVSVLLLTPAVIRLAHKMDWLAHPSGDRWHETPTALMGGIAIYTGATIAVLWAGPVAPLGYVWLGASVMFATGIADDLFELRPSAKVVAQVVATGLLVVAGYTFSPTWPLWIAVPLTFLWVIGITNAINLLDNMDGLSAGISAVAALVLTVMALLAGAPELAVVGVALVGAAVGFLIYNFKPARIFMGDGGSLFLGFSIAALAIIIQTVLAPEGGWAVYAASIAVLAVPIFDTTLVAFTRSRAGRSVSQGGRDHTSHRLVYLGLSERGAVLALYGVSLLAGALAIVYIVSNLFLFAALLAFLIVGLGVLGVYLARARVYGQPEADTYKGDGAPVPPPELTPLQRFVTWPTRVFGHRWKPVCGVAVDTVLVLAAFVLAYMLRFDSGLTASHEAFLIQALPLVAIAKIPVFFALGLYKAVWRYAGTVEVVRVVKATTVASLATLGLLALVFGFSSIALGVVVIDWMVVTLAVGGVRFGFRGLRKYLAAQRRTGRRTLIMGAGSTARSALRNLREDSDADLHPVGFVADDETSCGRMLKGLPVVSQEKGLYQLCRDFRAEVVLFALDEPHGKDIERQCREARRAGARCHNFVLGVEPVLTLEQRRGRKKSSATADLYRLHRKAS